MDDVPSKISPADEKMFPPEGWLTHRQTAARLNVSLDTLTCNGWKWRKILKAQKRNVSVPGGGQCNIYPALLIEKINAARAEAKKGPIIPDGFVNKDGACKWFGIQRGVWQTWIRQGKIKFGHAVATAVGSRQKLYAIKDLERLREELFGEDKLYKRADGIFHVPEEFVRREEAWERFGVGIATWERWEREGRFTRGVRVPGGPKLYKVEDIERLLEENGKFSPPYPDPDRPGVWRVPLGGRDIKRHEALIDAESLPLIESGSCHLGNCDEGTFVSFWNGKESHVPLRRLIMGVADSKLNVRHANGDPLDCRRENLVVITVKQRCQSSRKIKLIKGRKPTSRFKGVFWETYTKKWRVRIHTDGKSRSIGRFTDEIAAAVAYDETARKFFGEHAHLNFPDGVEAWLEKYRQHQQETQERAAA